MNRSKEKKVRQPNPIKKASILSKMTFWWLKPMFKISWNRAIEMDDIYEVTNGMESEKNTEAYAKLWDLELKKRNPNITRVIFKVHGYKSLAIGLLYSICDTFIKLIEPLCLGGFVGYFSKADGFDTTLNDAYLYATGIVFCTAFTVIMIHPFNFYMTKISTKIRLACSGLIYQKVLRLTKSSMDENQTGTVINLISNDLDQFGQGVEALHDIWRGPLESAAFFTVIYMQIGVAAVIGMVFLLSFIPLQLWIGKKSAEFRLKHINRTDLRVKIMDEILYGIQVIKMYAWEKSFANIVGYIRKKEMSAIRSNAYLRATINSFSMISKLSVFMSLIAYVYFGNPMTARRVYIVSSYFETLNGSMVHLWPIAITHVGDVYVSVKRLQDFLLRPETQPKGIVTEEPSKTRKDSSSGDEEEIKVEKNGINGGKDNMAYSECIKSQNTDEIFDKNHRKYLDTTTNYENGIKTIAFTKRASTFGDGERIQTISNHQKFIRFENVTAVWQRHIERTQMNGIFDMSTEIGPGLCAIIGQVGSSKSTLLNVIMGELSVDVGTITISGSLSYASQEPWLFDSTIRDNIVFVEDFDEQRYKRVIKVCALERDFEQLPNGDASIVGERGISLSGGQKARINLARACYRKADVYLLDDPLSAVDAHVGRHIFEKCIMEFLGEENKICVLVTHQLQYLSNVNHVILMNRGQIEAEGPFRTLQKINKDLLNQVEESSIDKSVDDIKMKRQRSVSSSHGDDDDDYDSDDDDDDRKEGYVRGAIKMDTYKAYFTAANNKVYVIVVFLVFIVAQVTWSGTDYFLSEWVNWEEENTNRNSNQTHSEITKAIVEKKSEENSSEPLIQNREVYVIIYTCLTIFGTLSFLGHTFTFYQMCLRISVNLHDMMFRAISRAKMLFFNMNPSGRILNRFSRNIDNVDSALPNTMNDVFDCLLQYLAILVIDAIVNPWLLIPATIMTVLFYVMRMIFINAGRSFIRIESLAYSPIFSHLNATLQGLPTVRAFNAGKMLEKEFHEFQDHSTACTYLFLCASVWFSLYMDIICLLFIATVTYSFLILDSTLNIHGGQVGLAIFSSIGLINICETGMRQTAEMENELTSVERIIEYTRVPSEPPLESDPKNAPPNDWPQSGRMEFKSLNFWYDENGSRILRNLTFEIAGKEKIGVVGRTGAGKSSIAQSIFRLAKNEGQIIIDGIDIETIGLHDLRKRISIIPQEPVLFSGTLRFNLDPFEERTDDELWTALEQVELKTVVMALPGAIDCKVQDGGSNFSVGQRQLICLARAILRNNRILILDEATANVDSETDALIQQTIRNRFADCTVITIAHRLNTIMDTDKVLVLDAGEIMEFGHPFELINKPDGIFKQLLDQTGASASTTLTLIAKESYERKHN